MPFGLVSIVNPRIVVSTIAAEFPVAWSSVTAIVAKCRIEVRLVACRSSNRFAAAGAGFDAWLSRLLVEPPFRNGRVEACCTADSAERTTLPK